MSRPLEVPTESRCFQSELFGGGGRHLQGVPVSGRKRPELTGRRSVAVFLGAFDTRGLDRARGRVGKTGIGLRGVVAMALSDIGGATVAFARHLVALGFRLCGRSTANHVRDTVENLV